MKELTIESIRNYLKQGGFTNDELDDLTSDTISHVISNNIFREFSDVEENANIDIGYANILNFLNLACF